MKKRSSRSIPEILTYFSHSYRSQDLDTNIFFWRLFCEHGFFFKVDPRSDFLSIPYLEYMMRESNCFVTIVTFREEEEYTQCSPYILFEYGLAVQAKKPKLVFIEKGVSSLYFGDEKNEVIEFDRDLLESRREEFTHLISMLKKRAKPYRNFPSKVGIVIDSTKNADKIYSASLLRKISDELRRRWGYQLEKIDLDFEKSYRLSLDLEQYSFLIVDENLSLISPWISAYVFGRSIPCIRLSYFRKNQSIKSVKFSPLISNYFQIENKEGKLKNIIYWTQPEQLLFDLNNHVKKIKQRRDAFKTKRDGDKYFRNLGRNRLKVFISNADDSTAELAEGLTSTLKAEFIDFFHYKEDDHIQIGEEWRKVLDIEIRNCGIFIPLIDRNYPTKKWCMYELEAAENRYLQNKMKIFPCLLEDKIPTVLENRKISEIQAKNIGRLSDDHKKVNAIIRQLDTFLRG